VTAPFDIRVTVRGGALHLLLSGELDIAGVPSLADALSAAAITTLTVVVDCRDLSFVDGRGAVTLLRGVAACRGGRLVGVRSHVRRVLDLVAASPATATTAARQHSDEAVDGRFVA
jgi:anti-anti-sigma factor